MIEISYGLISEDDFDVLPEDPQEKFVVFESISRRNLVKELKNEGVENNIALKIQYVNLVNAAAEELGIPGLYNFAAAASAETGFEKFIASVNSVVTKLRLRGINLKTATSVNVSIGIQEQIKAQVDGLRGIIAKSDFSENKKGALNGKLDELLKELSQQRVSFGKIMAIIAVVSMGVHGATGFLADAPEAIATITSLIGASKEAEDGGNLLLEGPATPKALPAPRTQAT